MIVRTPLTIVRAPLLIGEDNPYGADPHYALYPAPTGCAGHRLCATILGMNRRDYMQQFRRMNLCGDRWSMKTAKARAQEIVDDARRREWAVLCGSKVARAFHLEPATAESPIETHYLCDELGGGWAVIPHPSGRCRIWNAGVIDVVRQKLRLLMPDVAIGARGA